MSTTMNNSQIKEKLVNMGFDSLMLLATARTPEGKLKSTLHLNVDSEKALSDFTVAFAVNFIQDPEFRFVIEKSFKIIEKMNETPGLIEEILSQVKTVDSSDDESSNN